MDSIERRESFILNGFIPSFSLIILYKKWGKVVWRIVKLPFCSFTINKYFIAPYEISYNHLMIHNIGPPLSKLEFSPQKSSPQRIRGEIKGKRTGSITQASQQLKSSIQLNPTKPTSMTFSPSNTEKLLMLPFPFFMVGCCMSQTTVLTFEHEERRLSLSVYPGFLSCLKKHYTIPYTDIMSSKLMVAFNYRINKRQAYRLYLETRIGDFELTTPKNREEILGYKNTLDDILRDCRHGKP